MTVPFTDIDRKYGWPEGLLASMWKQESTCGKGMVSPKGACGHFQFMPATREEIMRKTGLDPWSSDPEVAARCAAHFLSDLRRQFNGNLEQALAAYNAGPGRVGTAVRNHGSQWFSALPAETRNYVPQILDRIDIDTDYDSTPGSLDTYRRAYATARETGSNFVGAAFVALIAALMQHFDSPSGTTTLVADASTSSPTSGLPHQPVARSVARVS